MELTAHLFPSNANVSLSHLAVLNATCTSEQASGAGCRRRSGTGTPSDEPLGEADLGTLTPGKLADLVVIDLDQAHLRPMDKASKAMRPASSWQTWGWSRWCRRRPMVHYGHPGCVESVMVEGRFLMRDREITCMNVQDTLDAAQEATVAAWRRLHETSGDIELPASMRYQDGS